VALRKDTCCRRFLPIGCQYPKRFERTGVREKGDALPRILCQDEEAFRFPLSLDAKA
jgi:hypothetical protein